MTKFTYGVYLGLFLGLFSSIVVYYFLPDLFPIYPNILSIFFFLSLLFALLRFIYKKVKQKSHQKLICTQNPGHIFKLSWTHGCFPVLNRGHPFCFFLNSFVIVIIYIFFHSCLKFLKGRIFLFQTIEHFVLHSGKKVSIMQLS